MSVSKGGPATAGLPAPYRCAWCSKPSVTTIGVPRPRSAFSMDVPACREHRHLAAAAAERRTEKQKDKGRKVRREQRRARARAQEGLFALEDPGRYTEMDR